MNNHMWEHAGDARERRDAARARRRRCSSPGAGRLASHGEAGAGRLPEPAELLAAIEALLAGGAPAALAEPHLVGLRVLVTAGGTREPIDAVRFVGNRSSGRMGFALAEQAAALRRRGHGRRRERRAAARPARALRRRRDRRAAAGGLRAPSSSAPTSC